MIEELKSTVRISLFEPRCRCCGNLLVFRDEEVICRACVGLISMNNGPRCKGCGKFMGEGDELCGDCVVNSPPLVKNVSYSLYDGVLKEVILLFKYGEIIKLRDLLAGYYIELYKKKINEDFDFIVPVPPDKGRKREFKPILEIAKILSGKLGIKLLKGNLVKIKKTQPQAALAVKERLHNLNGAFKLKDPAKIRGKRILLVDDVYTTGTTVKRCARLLEKEKARVMALTLARSL